MTSETNADQPFASFWVRQAPELAGENMMRSPESSEPLCARFPTLADRESAGHLRRILAAQRDSRPTLKVVEPKTKQCTEIALPSHLSESLLELLRCIEEGCATTIVPIQQKLTLQQAAELLNISRPHLIKLVEKNVLKYTMVGRHRRIHADDLFSYKLQLNKERSAALDELFSEDTDFF